ncbi:MAG: amino acid permease [Acidimicrobiales bacterium]
MTIDPAQEIPESLGYRLKRILLGPPLVTEQLRNERLSQPVALGVLAPDCISSTAYGSEEMLREMVPSVGLAAFSLLVPVTIAILVVLVFVTLSYREVVMVYTRAGGSYVVARDNFGSNVAQIAAVALLIDYTVTVAVQTAAGTDALVSAVPALTSYVLPITVGVVLLLVYGNLRGIREAGKTFALPTYFFILAISLVVGVGLVRVALGDLPQVHPHAGIVPLGQPGHGWLMGLSVFYLLRAFANGGSSLTGLEAISNGVGAFRPPEGRHARRVLVLMSTTLGTLVLGVSLLARFTHALPYLSGTPTVISQEAKAVFGTSGFGTALYLIVQLASLLILYTGANTSFNGFPFLASFVAEDSFLPRQLTRRGHRLTFSNGIIVLAVVSIALLIVTRAQVNSLVAIYAIGVFTGFTMAGAGMVKHHLTLRQSHYRKKIAINGSAAVLSGLVVLIFAVAKFTQGAYVVVILFPIMFYGLIRLNRQYRLEAAVLGEGVAARAAEARILRDHIGLVLVDRLDLATARAIQYARSLNPSEVRAVHFVLDSARADLLAERWGRLGLRAISLELIECPDRRLSRAALELAAEVAAGGETEVSILLPRRAYSRVWSRFLHDQTADRIVLALGQLDNVTATIVPFDVSRELARISGERRGRAARRDRAAARDALPAIGTSEGGPGDEERRAEERRAWERLVGERHPGERPPERHRERQKDEVLAALNIPGVTPISQIEERLPAKVAGRVRSVKVQPWAGAPSLECVLADPSGRVIITFMGRRQVPGIEPGSRLVAEGVVINRRGQPTILNPIYRIIAPAEEE